MRAMTVLRAPCGKLLGQPQRQNGIREDGRANLNRNCPGEEVVEHVVE